MKVVYHKEVEVKCCNDCPYCKIDRTMEGLLAFCMKMKELGCEPYENLIGGWGHTIYECIDKKCPLEKGWLTPNQRLRLKEKIDEIELVTGRKYVALTYEDENIYLSFVDNLGYYKADTFTSGFPSFVESAFKPGKLYLLSDLLGEAK